MTHCRYNQPGELWVLSESELGGLPVDYEKVLDIVESAYIALRRENSESPVKTVIEGPQQRSLSYSMVGRDGATNTVGFKAVYEFDPTRTRNAYSFHSFIFLIDDLTGEPICLIDVVRLGPLRSSATSALMARAACPDARTALVVGTGVQGQISLPMLVAALPQLERLMVYGTYGEGIEAIHADIARLYPGRKVEVVEDLARAAGEADIIIGAAGLTARAEVKRSQMKPGAIAVLLGYGIDADVLHGAEYVIATDAEQMRATSADLVAADGSVPPVDAELPDILLGAAPARRNPHDVVFAYNSGMVVTDAALGRYLADLAHADGKGVKVPLW